MKLKTTNYLGKDHKQINNDNSGPLAMNFSTTVVLWLLFTPMSHHVRGSMLSISGSKTLPGPWQGRIFEVGRVFKGVGYPGGGYVMVGYPGVGIQGSMVSQA